MLKRPKLVEESAYEADCAPSAAPCTKTETRRHRGSRRLTGSDNRREYAYGQLGTLAMSIRCGRGCGLSAAGSPLVRAHRLGGGSALARSFVAVEMADGPPDQRSQRHSGHLDRDEVGPN